MQSIESLDQAAILKEVESLLVKNGHLTKAQASRFKGLKFTEAANGEGDCLEWKVVKRKRKNPDGSFTVVLEKICVRPG